MTGPEQGKRLDRKFVVHSNDDSLSAADMALGTSSYRVWSRHRLKSGLRMRPSLGSTRDLRLERVAEQRGYLAEHTGRPAGDKTCCLPRRVWQVAEPRPSSRKRSKRLKTKTPPLILDLA